MITRGHVLVRVPGINVVILMEKGNCPQIYSRLKFANETITCYNCIIK